MGGNLSAGNRTGAGAENLMRPHTSLGLPPSVYMQYTYIQYIPYTYRIQRGPYTVYSAEGVYRYVSFPRVSGAAVHTVHARHLAIEYAFSAHMPILSPSLRICTFVLLPGIFQGGQKWGQKSSRGSEVGVRICPGATWSDANSYTCLCPCNIPSPLPAPPLPTLLVVFHISLPQGQPILGAWLHRASNPGDMVAWGHWQHAWGK